MSLFHSFLCILFHFVSSSGIAQHLRGNQAEAVKDLSSALKMKTRKWLMYEKLYKFACTFLERSRAGVPPVFGNWLPLTTSGCGNRYASAHTQCGKFLYVFGGLNHPPQVAYYTIISLTPQLSDPTQKTIVYHPHLYSPQLLLIYPPIPTCICCCSASVAALHLLLLCICSAPF